ncbi:MAG: 30S ribosomal protein S5 [Phycisphaeraceae bacterium]|nr:30S ribosomal protein S5 [Phycisphaeraceae bacterium]
MQQSYESSGDVDSTTVGIYRTSSTVAGGRRFSFSALVVVGDKNGRVGIGYAKSNQVPQSIEKAQREAKRKMKPYPMQGRTIPHTVEGRFGASKVRLIPASPGTGVIACAAVRGILDMFGIHDCLTKCYGSSNSKNLVKATLDALSRLRMREKIEALRGVELGTTEVEDAIRRGAAAMPAQRSGEKAAAPVNTVGDDRRRGGRGGPRGGGGRGGHRGGSRGGGPMDGGAPAAESTPADGGAASA